MTQDLPTELRGVLREVLLLFVCATLPIALLYQLRGVPLIESNLSVVAAVLFLYVPAGFLWRRRIDLERYGFVFRPALPSVVHFLLACVVVFPLFVLGYFVFLHKVCVHLPSWLVACLPNPAPRLRLPPQPLLAVIGQLFVVALPEEFFFRGYLMGRLREALPASFAIPLSALLFALGHLLVSFEPGTLAVFFPGLVFGLLRERTGSILAGTLFHAGCNLLIDVLHRSMG